MNTVKILLFIALVAVLSVPAITFAQARNTNIAGTIYNDKNTNGTFGGPDTVVKKKTKVYLYQILPNGSRKKIGQTKTNSRGRYLFKAQPPGKFFITVRLSKKLAVRTSPFTSNGVSRATVQNIPFVTKQTIKNYGFLSTTPNPGNLDNQPETTPF